MPINEYGVYIRSIRSKLNINLEDMANKLNVSKAYLSALENGKKTIPQDYADKLALAFELSNVERNDLKNSIDISNGKIQLEILKMNEEQREVSLAFARKIFYANEEELSELKKILISKGWKSLFLLPFVVYHFGWFMIYIRV